MSFWVSKPESPAKRNKSNKNNSPRKMKNGTSLRLVLPHRYATSTYPTIVYDVHLTFVAIASQYLLWPERIRNISTQRIFSIQDRFNYGEEKNCRFTYIIVEKTQRTYVLPPKWSLMLYHVIYRQFKSLRGLTDGC